MGDQAPEKRSVNTVFQNYALFPHMNVFQNIAYGLKIKKVSKAEIKERVTRMLSLVKLEGFEKRMPSEMSGGQ
ncbi:ATP-binding cassette domain-containing protein, partial [Klebsiella pneumoniae]|uniref:ATP-binding cassette domain-containing protein n=1 Tax=Klebsiella pneumoniae TaxID=573 RepID=UPI003AF48378